MGTGQKILIGCGVLVGGVVVLFVLLGFALGTGYVPEAEALPKGRIHPRILQALEEERVVSQGEEVQYFYSPAMFSALSQGSLFTDRRVLTYREASDGRQIDSAVYEEVAEIDFRKAATWVDDSTITVTTDDGDWFILMVSSMGDHDERFMERLEATWRRHRPESVETEEDGL